MYYGGHNGYVFWRMGAWILTAIGTALHSHIIHGVQQARANRPSYVYIRN